MGAGAPHPVPGAQWVQFRSAPQSCPTLCNPMDCSTPGLPVYHQLSWLMTLKTRSVHVRKTHLWEGDFSKRKTLVVLGPENISPKCFTTVPAWPHRDKIPCPTLGRNWWWKRWSCSRGRRNLMMIQDRQRSSPLTPSSEHKTAPHRVLRVAFLAYPLLGP